MRVLNEGTQLAGRYTLQRRLGAGGMSESWLASDTHSDARVVLKFLAADFADDGRYRDLLNKEWRIASRMMHAHIVRAFEFHDEPDRPYYSLQFIDGPDIAILAGRDPAESLRPVGLVADALRYAHAKDVVHRDIKASNILLDARGAPYLIDFGVAAHTGQASPGGGSPGGSSIAASPQQLAGDAPQPADDIYALGVLMHELVSGAPPVDGVVSLQSPDGHAVSADLSGLVRDMLAPDAVVRPDAETVATRLADAGMPAGPAPLKMAPGATGFEAPVEAIRPLRRESKFKPRVAAAPDAGKSSGVSPRVLYGGLATALVLFLAVIFVLPSAVDRQPSATGDSADEAPAGAGQAVTEETAGDPDEDVSPGTAGSDASFSENLTGGAGTKAATDDALGDLLSQLERLRYRAIDRWGGQEYLDVLDVYAAGDEAYLNKNYGTAGERYREASRMLEPFFDRIDTVFERTLEDAQTAFERADPDESVRLFDLAVAITPGHAGAEAGLARALNLQSVLDLMDQAAAFERDLELDAAKLVLEKALELDPAWAPATAGLERIRVMIKQLTFEQRMTEGFDALASGDFESARAAFNAAKALDPSSRQPADGLLQVDQEVRLANIRRLEGEASDLEGGEQWEESIGVYDEILEIDGDLQFAKEGLARANARAALHRRLQAYIDDPDSLSDPATMQSATTLLLDVTRMEPMGPRLEDQKNELSRLLKRASTPLTVQLVSDNATQVAIYRIGRLGTFATHQLSLRPGSYVAVGSRAGYRDVRLEFRVAPEIDMQPIVIQCEEPI